jgi:SAM-dependent methyltransferase
MFAKIRRLTQARAWPDREFSVPLEDLGLYDRRFAGVVTPTPEVGAPKIGISDQFLARASDYAAAFEATEEFKKLFAAAIGTVRPVRPAILDIGAGSGANSVLPCLDLFPGCRIVATDLSPDLLAILRCYVERSGISDRVTCVCTDATLNWFRPAAFDIALGAAILHHLMDPIAALKAAYSALRPGGLAIFYEPFEGWVLVGQAYRSIIDLADAGAVLPTRVRQFLLAMCRDLDARIGTDKSGEHFPHMDDKWLFTHGYVRAAAEGVGFRVKNILPHMPYGLAHHYRGRVELQLRRAGLSDDLPDWAWRIIDRLDSSLSPEMKAHCPLEATIILEKP